MPHNIKEKEMPQLNFNNVPKLTGPPTRVHTGQILHTIPISILNFQEKLSKIYTVFSGYKSSAKQNGKTVKEKKKKKLPTSEISLGEEMLDEVCLNREEKVMQFVHTHVNYSVDVQSTTQIGTEGLYFT